MTRAERERLLAELHARRLAPADAVVRTLLGGKTGSVLAVGDAGGPVVKVWDDLLAAERCAATLRMVGHRASAIVPRVIAVLPDPPAVVMERVEGKMWAQSLNASEAGSIERARRVGEALALLHRATTNTPVIPDHLERFRAYHLKKAALRLGAGGRSPEIRRVAAAVLTACAAQRRCLAHGDLTLLNVIVAPDRIAFVDFDMAWYGDPAFDLGMLAGSLIGGHLVAATAPQWAALPEMLGALAWAYREAGDGPCPMAEARAVNIALLRTRKYPLMRELLLSDARRFADVVAVLSARPSEV